MVALFVDIFQRRLFSQSYSKFSVVISSFMLRFIILV